MIEQRLNRTGPSITWFCLGLVLVVVTFISSSSRAMSADEIVEKMIARDDGDNLISDMEMILIDNAGHKRRRKIRNHSKDHDNYTMKLMFFMEPADVKNTGFLTYDYNDAQKDDDQWLYLPALRKTKRIASTDQSTPFMGSDFSYADLTKPVSKEWKCKLLKEDLVRDQAVWLIEAIPASKTIEERYGYTKSIWFIRKDNFMIIRAIHWVKKGEKLKYFDVKQVELIDGIWIGTQVHMKTTKDNRTQHRTILKWHNINFNQNLNEEVFTIRRLEKGI